MTAKNIRLLRRAQAVLQDIADWTNEQFGTEQAAKYLADLRDSFQDLANGTAQTTDCGDVVRNPPKGFRFCRSGKHFIIFVETGLEIVILDILHQRMDIAGKIVALKNDPKSR